ncbi:MAG TPA: glycosyltransferase family A protein, partial [Flavisolibacter sp.]|nr:glycosyltransferase family A protein [Flavisolibacter sp.]
TVERLQQQTLTNFEIIIVNDGSTDDQTLSVMKQLEGKGIKVLHKENGRMSSARNYGVAHARGTLIAALDADDYFHPSFFQKAVEVLESDKNTAVVSSHIQMFGALKKLSKPRGGSAQNFLFSNQCPACAMVRKSCWDAVGGYDEAMVHGYEDWEFYIRITQQGWTVHVIPEILFFYRQTQKSTLKNDTVPKRREIVSYIVDKHKDWYIEQLKSLITTEDILYRKSRISIPVISELIRNRLTKKYR